MVESRKKLMESFYILLEQFEEVADGKHDRLSEDIEVNVGNGIRIRLTIDEGGIKKGARLQIVEPGD